MAQSVISWTPGTGSNTLNQTIKYKLDSDTLWTTFNTVGPLINTATITGLLDNRIYNFTVTDNCSTGGPTISAVMKGIKMICAVVTVTPTHNAVNYSFTTLGGDVSKYVVELLNSAGSSVLGTQQYTSPGVSIASLFTALTPATTYNVRVTCYAGLLFEYSKVCPLSAFTTSAAPVCNVPTAVTVTLT